MSPSLARGAVLGLLTVGVERAVSFAVLLLLARALGAEHFGVFVYVLAGIMPIQVMADHGIEVAAVRLMAARPRSQAAMLTVVMGLRAAIWLLVAVPVALWVLPAWGGCAVSTALAGSLLALVGPSLPYRSVYRARQDMRRVWIIAAADALVGAAAVVAALASGAGVAGLLVARALGSLLVTGVVAAGSELRPGRRIPRPLVAGLIDSAWPLALNALLLTLMVRLGQLVAMRLLDAESVGRLGAAGRVAEIISLIPEGVMMAVFPAMAARRHQVGMLAADAARHLSALALWTIVVCSAGAAAVMSGLFGEAYLAGADALRILCWTGLTSAAGSVALHRLITANRQRLLLLTNVGAAGAGVGLHAVLVPTGGIEGAAFATLATLVTGQVLLLVDGVAREAVLEAWRAALPPLLLAIGVLGAVWFVADPVVAAAGAALLFPVGAWLAGIVDRAAVARIARALRPRRL